VLKNSTIYTNSNVKFGNLLEPNRASYTARQEKLANLVRDIAEKPCKDDRKNQSYKDYYKNEFGMDLYIKPNNKNNSIELYAHNSTENSFDIIHQYKKGIKPKETDFTAHIDYLKDEIHEHFEKAISYSIIGIMLILGILLGNKKSLTETSKNITKTELVQKF